MKSLGYDGCDFKVLQDAENLETISKINEIENSFLSNQQLLVKKSQELLEKEKEIFELKTQLQANNDKLFPFSEITEEMKALQDDIESVSYANVISTDFYNTDTIPTFKVTWKKNSKEKIKASENIRLQNWLRKKLKNEKVIVTN